MRSPSRFLGLFSVPVPYIACILLIIRIVNSTSDLWPLERPEGMPSIQSLEVMCGKDHMDVHLTFSQPFEGIVSSKGQHGDPRCVYVPPSTGQTFFSFRIAYARCGTKPDLHGQFYENTVVVQYDKDLLEVWDEAKRLRCEWFNDYEKTASKPPMVIADLDVIQLDFRGDNVDCWMEIQHGKGPWAPPVSGIVPLGSTLTLVVAINDYRGEFDMRVKSCVASDGAGHVIQLSDEFGCVLRPKMISRFLKARGADERASVITYAFFHAFKFPDALSVHIKCKVEICRHGCLDHCQLQPNQPGDIHTDLPQYSNPLERKDDKISSSEDNRQDFVDDDLSSSDDDRLYEDIIHESNENDADGDAPSIKLSMNAKLTDDERFHNRHRQDQHQSHQHQQQKYANKPDGKGASAATQAMVSQTGETELDITALPHKEVYALPMHDTFPHGPRTFDVPVAAPRSLDTEPSQTVLENASKKDLNKINATSSTKNLSNRRRRSVVVSDGKAKSTDVGVSGLYEVISEADLAFSPDNKAEAVTVFQGRREEVVYGICMPVPGFSVLFVLVAVSAVVSALVAGSLLYRYQMQKAHLAEQAQRHNGSIPISTFSNWVGFLRMRNCGVASTSHHQTQNGKPSSSMMVNGKTGSEPHSLN